MKRTWIAAAGLLLLVPAVTVAHDPNLEGVRVSKNGQLLVEVWQGIRTGTLSAPLNLWSDTLDIVFLDPFYQEYYPPDPEETLSWFIGNTSTLQAQQVGQWAVKLRGIAPGATTFAVVVWHVDHTAFYSGDIPTSILDVTDAPSAIAGEAAGLVLEPPVPNPARGLTTLAYSLDRERPVALEVVDVAGRVVATLARGSQAAGTHTISWDATGEVPGVYFLRMAAGPESRTRKLVVAR